MRWNWSHCTLPAPRISGAGKVKRLQFQSTVEPPHRDVGFPQKTGTVELENRHDRVKQPVTRYPRHNKQTGPI